MQKDKITKSYKDIAKQEINRLPELEPRLIGMSCDFMEDNMDSVKLFKMSCAYGVCSKVYNEDIANSLTYQMSKCDMPGCHEPSVRLGIYEDDDYTEYRQLCERHKNIGIWGNNGGWDIE